MGKQICILSLVLAFAVTASANLLVNPSFEDDVLADGTLTGQYVYPTGWLDGDPAGTKSPKRDVRVWNPTGDGSSVFTGGVPEGDNVSYSVEGQYGPATMQIVDLGAPIALGDSLRIAFDYGQPSTDPLSNTPAGLALYYIYTLNSGVYADMWNAGNYLKVDEAYSWTGDDGMDAIPTGSFARVDNTFTIDETDAVGDQYVAVYLVGYGGACLDNVVFTPEPATMSFVLLGSGLCFLRRKK